MNEQEARRILGDNIQEDGNLLSRGGQYIQFDAGKKVSTDVTLDGYFTADDLEAIAWWMRNHESK